MACMVNGNAEYAQKACVSSDCDRELLKHGIQIILNDGLNFIAVLIGSHLLHADTCGWCYIISFAMLRRYSGGWHAPTHLTCFMAYQSLFAAVLGFSSMDINVPAGYVIFILISALTGLTGPVEHWLNPLTEAEREKNRYRLRRNLAILNVMYPVMVLLKRSILCNVLLSSLTLNYVCMILQGYSMKRRKYADSVRNC